MSVQLNIFGTPEPTEESNIQKSQNRLWLIWKKHILIINLWEFTLSFLEGMTHWCPRTIQVSPLILKG